ncbi:MAG: glycogen debranching protein GlgX [Nostocoides sp.]|jgi:isoamylase|uniref:glycogen debranching protein GlgX n=1 Tax=Nostocoides sp. TaxID=1917966 RepID=UPI003C7286BB
MSDTPPVLTPAPGMHLVPGGADFRVFAGHADAVWVVVDDGQTQRRFELAGPEQGGWWAAHLPGVVAGDRYAVHAAGPSGPDGGHRYDARQPLLDPYARGLDAQGRAVVIDDTFDWGADARPRLPWTSTVIYEAHVRGLTMTHPDVPIHQRGTYAGLTHPAVLDHLRHIGVTTIELLPVHAFVSEWALLQRGLINYWGYNTLAFFAPHPRYAAHADPQGVVDEFKTMVKGLHAAGFEVVLDVVYNHTAEQGAGGRTLSWRGLDNATYYRLDAFGQDIDFSGCGNTLDARDPVVIQLILDSLRYWVSEMHVDGFRFDLAVALARDKFHDYDPDHPLLIAVRADPVLASTKLIVEPWDVGMGGWRTGQFPPPFAEWNDRYRDDVRTFWLSDLAAAHQGQARHGARDLATRMAGSQDLFGHHHRGPVASINFVAAHDGFTTADLTAYNEKHNEANGEGNRDGAAYNRSWNHGVEGASDDENLLVARRRSLRNLLGTLLLSAGVPMLNAGDEFGRTQRGNNNAYCQDNEIGWLDWDPKPWQAELVDSVAALARIRRDHPVIHPARFFTGEPLHDGGPPDLSWFAADGERLAPHRWEDPSTRTLSMLLRSPDAEGADVLIVINGAPADVEVALPEVAGRRTYEQLWDSAVSAAPPAPGAIAGAGATIRATAASLQVWASRT